MQRALQRIAKPWYRRRALRVFRDSTGLSVNPHLWGSIQTAMDESDWFILLTSPEAAASPWVNREIEHWTSAKDPNRILPVVTDGEWHWHDDAGDFDRARSTALPAALAGVYENEPRHLDLRWARTEHQLELRNGRFRDAIAELAAPIRGTTKDELEDDDIRLHRRAVRTAIGGVAVLAVALVAAVIGAALAVGNAHRAEDRERDAQARALSATSRSLLADQLDVALLLAVEGYDLDQSAETRGSLVAALERAPQLERILQTSARVESLDTVAFAPDGRQVIAGGSFVARDSAEGANEAPLFRWQLDGTDADTESVPGGTITTVRASGDAIDFESVGDTSAVGRVGADDVIMETSLFTTLSPKGTRAAVFRPNRIVELVDLETGELLYDGRGGWQVGLNNFSPDGRWAALPARAGEAVVLDARSGEPVGAVGAVGDDFEEVVFSANGDALAASQASGRVSLWQVGPGGLEPRPLQSADVGPVSDLAVSGDGTRLAALGSNGHVAVWDAAGGTRLWDAFREPPGVVVGPEEHRLVLSHDGATLLEAGPSVVSLRDATTGEMLSAPQPTGTLTPNPDGSRVAVTGEVLSVWDLEQRELIGTHPSGDGAALFSPDRRFLATYSRELLVWDITRRELTPLSLDDGAESVTEVAFDAESTRLASVGDGRAARVWTLAGPTGLVAVDNEPRHEAYGRLAAIDPTTGTTAVFERYGAPVIVRPPDDDAVRIDVDNQSWFLDIAGDRLVTRYPVGNDETRSTLWDGTTGERVAKPLVCGSGDSAFLSSATTMTADRIVNVNKGEISVCDADDGDEVTRFDLPGEVKLPFEGSFSAAITPDASLVAIGAPDGTVSVIDLESEDVVASIPFGDGDAPAITSVAFGPDGQDLVFATSFPGRIGVWTVGSASDDVEVLEPAAEYVTAVAVSPDREHIATAGEATAVTEAPTEIELRTRDGEGDVDEPLPWPYPTSEIYDLEFAADGTELHGVSLDGGLVRWQVADAGWRDLACRLAGRNLTRAEWERFIPDRDYRNTCPEWPAGE